MKNYSYYSLPDFFLIILFYVSDHLAWTEFANGNFL